MADDIKAIESMEVEFKKLAAEGPQDDGPRKEYASKIRRQFDSLMDWYEANALKQTGTNPANGMGLYEKLPLFDEKLKSLETGFWKIFNDFNSRGCKTAYVRDFIESYLDKIREGWGKKLADHNQRIGL